MTKRISVAILSLATLIACEPGPIHGTVDSGVNRLELGMSPEAVNAMIGAPVAINSPAEITGMQCYSYVYDEVISPRYAHVRFVDSALVGASDRHRDICDKT